MVIFLYGPDGYRLKENVAAIVGAYQKKYKSGMSYYRFDLENEASFDGLSNAVKSISFFDEAKLILVKNSFSSKYYVPDKLKKLLDDFNVSSDKKVVIVFAENRSGGELQKLGKDLFSVLNTKQNLFRNIEYLEGAKLANWVRSKFKESGHNASPAVADLLIDAVGSDSWALANEIEKLSNYKRGSIITEKDINILVGRKETNSIFELTDAVGSQNKAKAFEMMFRLLNSGQDGYYLLNMLFYHFENLLSVCDAIENNKPLSSAEIAKKCGLHPFVAKKAVNQVKKFSRTDLKAKSNCLAGLDISSKNGLTNLEDSLYNFVLGN